MADEAVETDEDDYDSEEDTEPLRADTSTDDSGESWYTPIKENNKPVLPQVLLLKYANCFSLFVMKQFLNCHSLFAGHHRSGNDHHAEANNNRGDHDHNHHGGAQHSSVDRGSLLQPL